MEALIILALIVINIVLIRSFLYMIENENDKPSVTVPHFVLILIVFPCSLHYMISALSEISNKDKQIEKLNEEIINLSNKQEYIENNSTIKQIDTVQIIKVKDSTIIVKYNK